LADNTSVDNNAKGASNHNGCFKVIPATQTSHFGKIHRPNSANIGQALNLKTVIEAPITPL
jgi:hypothetical protein